MRLCKFMWIIVVIGVLNGCSANAPSPHLNKPITRDGIVRKAEIPKASFGEFSLQPGESINLPDFPLKIFGVVYRYDWPEAGFIIGRTSWSSVTLGLDGSEFFPMEPLRERRNIVCDYEGLIIHVKELGRDNVVFDVQSRDSKSYSILSDTMTPYDLRIGDRLVVPGGYLSPQRINRPQGTCRIWYFPDDGYGSGLLHHHGKSVWNIVVPGVELGLVHLTGRGVSIEARFVDP